MGKKEKWRIQDGHAHAIFHNPVTRWSNRSLVKTNRRIISIHQLMQLCNITQSEIVINKCKRQIQIVTEYIKINGIVVWEKETEKQDSYRNKPDSQK